MARSTSQLVMGKHLGANDHTGAFPAMPSEVEFRPAVFSAVARLEAEIAAQAALIAEQAAGLAHFRKLFERASEAARIGVWHCELDGERLTWTDVVYDLFDLPRGAPLDRAEILKCYPPESRRKLDSVRGRALAEGGGFEVDLEIVTFAGISRWIRITATVEREAGRAVRLFGMKQDVTEQRRLAEELRRLAEQDPITGLANRTCFESQLARFDAPGDPMASGGALIVLDLDGFKAINDAHGHAAGDLCLRVCGSRLAEICEGAALIARIGGDEFAVVLGPGHDVGTLAALADRVVAGLSRPIPTDRASLRVGASVGLALACGCGSTLYRAADAAMYAAKTAGRNCWRMAACD